MARPTFASINLDHLRHNLAVAKGYLTKKSRLMAVVKANAYGHGIVEVARSLKTEVLAVATIDEALELRSELADANILVLEGFSSEDEIAEVLHRNIEVVIHHQSQYDLICQWQRSQSSLCSVFDHPLILWLKVNTGMNRLGVPLEKVAGFIRSFQDSDRLFLKGVMTHFSSADDPDPTFLNKQLKQFKKVISFMDDDQLLFSCASSAALLRYPDTHLDFCRLGISLYGASPFQRISASELQLKPVMSFCSKIISTQNLEKGERVGYGSDWQAVRVSRIGIVAAGYGDGYPRHAPCGTPVRVGEIDVPLVGRVSMDMLTVDLTDHPCSGVGSDVELWGQTLPVDVVAAHSGTIGYDLLTGVMPRVPRIYSRVSAG